MEKREFRTWDETHKIMDESDTSVFLRGDGKVYELAEETHDTPNIELVESDLVIMFKIEKTDDKGEAIWQGDVVKIKYKKVAKSGIEYNYQEVVLVDNKEKIELNAGYDNIEVEKLGNIYEEPQLKDKVDRLAGEGF